MNLVLLRVWPGDGRLRQIHGLARSGTAQPGSRGGPGTDAAVRFTARVRTFGGWIRLFLSNDSVCGWIERGLAEAVFVGPRCDPFALSVSPAKPQTALFSNVPQENQITSEPFFEKNTYRVLNRGYGGEKEFIIVAGAQ